MKAQLKDKDKSVFLENLLIHLCNMAMRDILSSDIFKSLTSHGQLEELISSIIADGFSFNEQIG